MDEKSDRNAINKLIADAYFHNNKSKNAQKQYN